MARKSEFSKNTDLIGVIKPSTQVDVHISSRNRSTMTAMMVPVLQSHEPAPAQGLSSILGLKLRRPDPEVQVMARTFRNFEAYKDQQSPRQVSKVDFEQFKSSQLSSKHMYDFNLGHRLTAENKILACKNREQTLRAVALAHNVQHLISMMDTHEKL